MRPSAILPLERTADGPTKKSHTVKYLQIMTASCQITCAIPWLPCEQLPYLPECPRISRIRRRDKTNLPLPVLSHKYFLLPSFQSSPLRGDGHQLRCSWGQRTALFPTLLLYPYSSAICLTKSFLFLFFFLLPKISRIWPIKSLFLPINPIFNALVH